MKKAISIRLDTEIIDFFRKRYPTGYQSGISAVLKKFVQKQEDSELYAAGRAQEIYRQFHAQCFWHLRKDLEITVDMLPLVKAGLRRHGGVSGFKLAQELDELGESLPCP